MPVADAVAAKWSAGRAFYGPEWQGDDPLVEAHDDAIDVLAYLEESLRRRPTVAALGAREWTGIAVGAIRHALELLRESGELGE